MSTDRRSSWRLWAGVTTLLAVHALLALWAISGKSITVDEIFHVTGGYFYDKFGDFRLHPDNGVLPQRLQALPAVLAGAKPPPMEGSEYWRTSDVYVLSYQFFYESGNDHWPMLMHARMMNLIFSVGLCLVVFVWARALAGPLAGLTALCLAVFSPTVLAHGPLATTDVAAAAFLTASVGAFWWQLRAGGWGRLALSATAFGLACVSKYSAALLPPIFVALLIVYLVVTPRENRRTGWMAVGVAGHIAVGLVIIWACYGFRYTAFAPGVPAADHFVRDWSWMLARAGWQAGPIGWLRDWRIFPEAYLFGYLHTYIGSLTRGAFLAGEYSNTGWKMFFPLAFLWKSTPAELAGVVLALGTAVLHHRRLSVWLVRLAPLLALAAAYGAVSITSHLNIGQRHLLPLYPALFIVTGVAVARVRWPERGRLALAGAFGATQLLVALLIFPSFLAYFNPLAGGPARGWTLLVDSSLDWGQELPGLKKWLEKNNSGPGRKPVFLSYFGSGDPRYYDIRATWLPFIDGSKFIHPRYELHGGVYCISATTLQQVYSPVRGPWTAEREQEYQQLRQVPLNDLPTAAWTRFDLLRFARLCACLRAREPDAMIGYSVLIYRLTDDEVDAAVNRRYSDWLAAVESGGRH